MNSLIDAAFSRGRAMMILLVMILTFGAVAYVSIPKEANPEVPLPLVYVSTTLDGISPSDAERLLIEPMEAEFGAIEGLEKMSAEATEGFASVQLEFAAGGDIDEALDKRIAQGVNAPADRARVETLRADGQIRLAQFERRLASAEARFAQLTGVPPPPLLQRPPVLSDMRTSRDYAVMAASETPAVKSAEAAAEAIVE